MIHEAAQFQIDKEVAISALFFFVTLEVYLLLGQWLLS